MISAPPPSLTLESCLEYARSAVSVLPALKATNGKMTYQQFAKGIGSCPPMVSGTSNIVKYLATF